LISRETLPPPLRCIPWFWRFLGFCIVLSEAVLVIVIDGSRLLPAGLCNTSEFHRHASQHRDDPMQHRFHRITILNPDALCGQQYIWDGGTLRG